MRTSTLVAAIVTGSALGTLIVGGSLVAAYHPAPTPVAPAAQQLAPTPVPASPAYCAREDGSGSALPCRWDAGARGNGSGQSYWVLPTAGGGRAYAYDSEVAR